MPTPPTSKFEFAQKAERSFRRAVRKLYEERARNNDTVSIWRDGKVLIVPARDLLDGLDHDNAADGSSVKS
jgi:hypothetical protein